ncbi:MAG: DUF4294 domain-containing protein [Bacteroidia bacterium]|nr:DUF4294 domain-containing protein [Bacteroidia bacterium]
MIKITGVVFVLIFITQFSLCAQNNRSHLQRQREAAGKDTLFKGFMFPSRDSIFHFNMREIEIISPYKFKNKRQEKKYNQLEIDVVKTYPLALLVGSEVKLVNSELDSVYTDKSKRKTYIKWYQNYVYKTYMDSLKKLNLQQGRLLLKLIHRETGKSPYELIKLYRGGLNAIFWQSAAFMFGANLNSGYDPEADAMIEHIIRRYKAGEFN